MIRDRATCAFAPAGRAPARAGAARRAFTLVELLITISIIGIMSSMVLFAMWQSQETAKEHRTRALITKLNSIVMRRYDEYRTRRVPFVFPVGAASNNAAQQRQVASAIARARLDCLRDLMRLEMPDRWSDVTDLPVAPFPHTLPTSQLPAFGGTMSPPAVSASYRLKYNNIGTATVQNQGAECLYMIVMDSLANDGDGRDFFKPTDIGDTDGDQFPEFLDAWGQPIQFIRWAPGFQSPLQTPIRLSVTLASAGTNEVTVNVTANDGPRLSQTPGSYVGGAMVIVDNDSQIIDTAKMAPITGYNYTLTPSPSVRFTCATPSGADPPLGGLTSGSYTVLVMQPDPFDSRQVYPIYSPPTPDLSGPTYAIYPLIYSKGKDRVSGLVDDVATIRYADATTVALNPFYVPPAMTEVFGLMLGSALHQNGTEPNWYKGAHLDNITNHQLGTR